MRWCRLAGMRRMTAWRSMQRQQRQHQHNRQQRRGSLASQGTRTRQLQHTLQHPTAPHLSDKIGVAGHAVCPIAILDWDVDGARSVALRKLLWRPAAGRVREGL